MRFILLLLLMSAPVAAMDWSEIMFDAKGRDFGKEWIELTGDERLEGCTVTDSFSSDTLELLQEGTDDIILIVESDHVLDLPQGSWIYGAGKAIGNGLGNEGDRINISCNQTVLSTAYDAGDIDGWHSGMSIVYDDGWHAGTENGTPGIIPDEEEEPETETVPEPVPEAEESGSGFCNTTLAITLSSTEGYPGDPVLFTVVSDGYAGFMAETNGTIILEGDTLTRRSYSLTLPDDDVKLSAYARQCDARQRAVRHVTVLEPLEEETVGSTDVAPQRNLTVNETMRTEDEPDNHTQNMTVKKELRNESVPIVTGSVVYDQDRNVVPWVSAFGMVTLVVSAGLFWKMRKEGI